MGNGFAKRTPINVFVSFSWKGMATFVSKPPLDLLSLGVHSGLISFIQPGKKRRRRRRKANRKSTFQILNMHLYEIVGVFSGPVRWVPRMQRRPFYLLSLRTRCIFLCIFLEGLGRLNQRKCLSGLPGQRRFVTRDRVGQITARGAVSQEN